MRHWYSMAAVVVVGLVVVVVLLLHRACSAATNGTISRQCVPSIRRLVG